MKNRIIKQWENFRIVEVFDEFFDFDDLCGDSYNPEVNTDLSPETLNRELEDFRRKVECEGVFGYVLEKWNPSIGHGWESVESCFGFVGQYSENDPDCNHYIVQELFEQSKKAG